MRGIKLIDNRQRLSEAAKKRWEKKRLAAEARQKGRKKAAEDSTQENVEDSEEKSPSSNLWCYDD